jgi:hypothetical protein
MSKRRHGFETATALTLFALSISSPVIAEPVVTEDEAGMHPILSQKFFASIGLFRPDQRMLLSLDASIDLVQPTPLVDFSKTFGFKDDDETASAEIGWRFGEKWLLRGQYFRVDNKTRATLQEDVAWGDYVFNDGTAVAAGTDMQVTRVFFGRKMSQTDDTEFGIGLGLHILAISAFVNGNATVNGIDVGFREEAASISQPLPNIGAWYLREFSPKWVASVRLDWFSAEVGDYGGRIVNAAASVIYAPSSHFGIGLAYNYFELDVKVKDVDWNGNVNARFNGPYISLNGYW